MLMLAFLFYKIVLFTQGPCSKEESVEEIVCVCGGGGGVGMLRNFLFNFSKVTENAFISINYECFSTSSVMLLLVLKICHH